MNYKAKYTITGAAVGAVAAIFLWMCQCACAFLSCEDTDSGSTVLIFFCCISVGALIGLLVGVSADKEEDKRLELEREYERQELERKRLEQAQMERERKLKERNVFLESKRNFIKEKLDKVFKLKGYDVNFLSTDEPAYQEFLACREESSKDSEIQEIWNEEYSAFIKRVDSFIKSCISNIVTHKNDLFVNARIISNMLKILKLMANSNMYDGTIENLDKLCNDFLHYGTHNISFLSPGDEYGSYNFTRLDDEEVRPEFIPEDLIENDIRIIEEHLAALNEISKEEKLSFKSYETLSDLISCDDYVRSVWAMWCYAARKPFDVAKFERACKIASWFNNYKGLDSMETMTVRIYNWKSIGDSDIVKEYTKDIIEWIENVSAHFYNKETGENTGSGMFYNFVSALAWMELYDLELMVLKKLVDLKVQLWPEAQERLKFLSSGGTAHVKIYNPDDDIFSFDNGSLEWKDKEYDIFFRKLKMKNISLNYSLVIKEWSRTYPLQSNQKYSEERLYQEFEDMMDDYDNDEVTFSIADAKSLNLKNVYYKNAAMFRFKSDRNRCVTMLFYAEKFGKNLNITILTLFTPEEGVSEDDLYKYAVAIKNNVYTESFRENILESLDAVLKSKPMIYSDFSEEPKASTNSFSDFFD